jgi:hypothetical protein
MKTDNRQGVKYMRSRLILAFILGWGLHWVGPAEAKIDKLSDISIAVHKTIIAKMIKTALPVEIAKDKNFSGKIWITAIDKLILGKNHVSCLLRINGKNIKYSASIGSQSILLDVGDINVAFNCGAAIRYDGKKRVLYVKPQITQKMIQGSSNQAEAVILQLLTLFNDQEYPIEIQKLEPILVQFGGNSLNINMQPSDIYTENDTLFIGIKPVVTKTAGVSPK